MLESSYNSEDSIPEGLGEHYKEQSDGSFKLQLSGGVKTQADVSRVKEALDKEKTKRKNQAKVLNRLNVKVYDDGSYDKERIEQLKNPKVQSDEPDEESIREDERNKWREERQQLEDKRDKAWVSAESYVKDSTLRKVMAEKGFVDPKGLDNFLLQIEHGSDPDFNEARNLLRTVEANHDDSGFKVVGGSVGDQQGLYDVAEKVSALDISAHYQPAKDNHGGGSRNNGKQTTDNNPYDPDNPNITEQAKLEKSNPAQAKQLASKHDISLNGV